MPNVFQRRLLRCAAALLAGCLSAIIGSPARADELAELRARLEALERQNALLSERLDAAQPQRAEPLPFPRAVDPAGHVILSGENWTPPTVPPAAPISLPAASSADDLTLTARWNHGLELQTRDKRFRVHVGGRTQIDGVWLQHDAGAFDGGGGNGDEDSVNFRRGRFRIDGTMFEFIDWGAEYDFVNTFDVNRPNPAPPEPDVITAPAITDMWVNFKGAPVVGNVRIGQFKEPIGFDHLHSSRWLNFLERSYNQDAFNGPFNNGFSPGVMIWNTYLDERGTWATGVFKNSTNIFGWGIGDGEYAWTSRATYLVLYDEASRGANLLHVGVAGSLRDTNNGLVQYRSRGTLRNGPPGPLNPVFVNTLPFESDTTALAGLEVSGQYGPLNVNAEYIGNWNTDSVGNGFTSVAGAPLGTVYFNGWYVEALYFLTGEQREYDRKAGIYSRIIPHENFRFRGGLGAWQLGLRYNRLDLSDTGINGGQIHDVTVGLNWFLNPNMKFQWNYVYTDRDAPANVASNGGAFHGFGTRFAYDF